MKDSKAVPKLVANLSYVNSPFTQLSKGTLSMKVNSWNFNGSAFPQNYYLTIKVGATGDPQSCKRLYNQQEFKLSNENMLETLNIIVS